MAISLQVGLEESWLIKTDASGNEQWNRTFGGKDFDVTVTSSVKPTIAI
jgi:hypothetical protein